MLTIPLPTIGWIILKAREFDVKDVDTDDENDDESNPMGVLEDRDDDPTEAELRTWIDDMTDRQRSELVALFWLGRDDGDPEDFPNLVNQAAGEQSKGTARYLLGSPLLGDYLEEGLERLGVDTSELESELT